jgi:hypothetical protein
MATASVSHLELVPDVEIARKRELEAHLTQMTGGDLIVEFKQGHVSTGVMPSKVNASENHLWCITHADPYEPDGDGCHLFWIDDRDGGLTDQIVEALKSRASLLLEWARMLKPEPTNNRKASAKGGAA